MTDEKPRGIGGVSHNFLVVDDALTGHYAALDEQRTAERSRPILTGIKKTDIYFGGGLLAGLPYRRVPKCWPWPMSLEQAKSLGHVYITSEIGRRVTYQCHSCPMLVR